MLSYCLQVPSADKWCRINVFPACFEEVVEVFLKNQLFIDFHEPLFGFQKEGFSIKRVFFAQNLHFERQFTL